MSEDTFQFPAAKIKKYHRVILDDRKGFLDHFKPRALMFSTIRVTMFQALNNVTHYYHDQLEYEQNNHDLVRQRKITPQQAQQLNDEFEDNEWKIRLLEFPQKVGTALAKFHAMTLCMRFYETILCEKILNVDKITLDDLTLDLFKYSLRRKEEHENDIRDLHFFSKDATESKNSSDHHTIGQVMKTCLWANLIGFAADCTVQQMILLYTYAKYWWKKRAQSKEIEQDDSVANNTKKHNMTENSIDYSVDGGLMLSFFIKSCRLVVARSIGLVCASFGGALGSTFYPGYGILFGSQVGDAVSVALFD